MLASEALRTIVGDVLDRENVRAEVTELAKAMQEGDPFSVVDALADTVFFVLCWLQQEKGVDLELGIGNRSADKFRRRNEMIKQVFARAGIPWDKRVLREGSNILLDCRLDRILRRGAELAGKPLSSEARRAAYEARRALLPQLLQQLQESKDA